jgi:methionine-S-sulfoxide reductase
MIDRAILAGGCFWGMEQLFSELPGVIDVVNGYSGGDAPNPNYKLVSSGLTNYAEAIEVVFDANSISYEEILKFFFKIHDPTTLNQQGNDVGTQYRSAIFYIDQDQKDIAKNLIDKNNKAKTFGKEIVTKLEEYKNFYKAEEYHQDYLEKNPDGYTCHYIREDLNL